MNLGHNTLEHDYSLVPLSFCNSHITISYYDIVDTNKTTICLVTLISYGYMS